ncbi:unnamed protein product [Moneuplotes crassus]|uniref:Uncharacterized protein n=1 Tax=Euplotes crassus TaxID=5936 RepID=A0AAD1Y2F8_EUPCR|nr:unnamed protein product [Moneuplotes crassus]
MESYSTGSSDDYNGDTQGLMDKTNKRAVPLSFVETIVDIYNNIAQIEFLQYYVNDKDDPIEAEHVFPIHTSCTLTSFKAYVGDEVLESKVEERSSAKRLYSTAVQKGETAAIAHPFPKTNDIMEIQLGNIPPNVPIILSCIFHQVMEVEDLSWKLHIPSKIFPRYVGDVQNYIEKGINLKGMVKNMYPDTKADRQEHHIDRLSSLYSSNDFQWNLDIKIHSQSPLTRIVSPTHQIETKFSDDNNQEAHIMLSPSEENLLFKKDFKILYRNHEINKPTAIMQKKDNLYVLMVCMLADCTPEKEFDENREEMYKDIDLDPDVKYKEKIEIQTDPPQFTFVLDCSTSMRKKRIVIAKEALTLYIRSLPPRCEFNILCFGGSHKFMMSSYQTYNDESVKEAMRIIDGIKANNFGTELYSCFETLFSSGNVNKSLQNHVVLLTDGLVANPECCYELIKENSDQFTLNTFGIGSGVSTDFIRKCAEAGGGKYYLVDNTCSTLKENVINCLSGSFEEKITVSKKNIATIGNDLYEYPKLEEIECSMAHGSYFTYYRIIDTRGKPLRGGISFYVQEKKNGEENDIYLEVNNDVKMIDGDFIFKMFCDQYIRGSDKLALGRDVIVEMSLKFQIASGFTSMIIVDSENLVKQYKQAIEEVKKADNFDFSSAPKISDSDADRNMPITVATLAGDRTHIMCSENNTVEELFNEIACKKNCDPSILKVSFRSKQLRNDKGTTLGEAGFKPNTEVLLIPRLTGGGFPLCVKSRTEIECDKLVGMQSYDGSWGSAIKRFGNFHLEHAIQNLPREVRDLLAEDKIESILYTWLALKIIDEYFSDQKDELELVIRKGKDYIFVITNGHLDYEDINESIHFM